MVGEMFRIEIMGEVAVIVNDRVKVVAMEEGD